MKVRKQDIFRPCAMSTTKTATCVQPPADYFMEDEHAVFFSNQTINSYKTDGYPWTRLGYTYDWNPRTGDYGVSEYVIKKNSKIEVVNILSTEAYCSSS